MLKKILIQVGLGLLLVMAGAVAGRYFAPVKVVTEVKTEEKVVVKEVETVKWKTVYVQQKAEQKRVVTVKKPDGTQVRIEDTNTQVQTARQEVGAASRTNETTLDHTEVATKTETRQSLNTVVLMVGTGLDFTPSYGVSYTRNLIGPVGVGAWVMKGSDVRIGLNLGFTF